MTDAAFCRAVNLHVRELIASVERSVRAPFDRPDLFTHSERHGSGRIYFLQPALDAAKRDEARAVLRADNPFSSIQWFDDASLVVWGLE